MPLPNKKITPEMRARAKEIWMNYRDKGGKVTDEWKLKMKEYLISWVDPLKVETPKIPAPTLDFTKSPMYPWSQKMSSNIPELNSIAPIPKEMPKIEFDSQKIKSIEPQQDFTKSSMYPWQGFSSNIPEINRQNIPIQPTPKIQQPQEQTSWIMDMIVPTAQAEEPQIDQNLVKEFIDHWKSLWKSREEIETAYNKAYDAWIFNTQQPIQPAPIVEKPQAWFKTSLWWWIVSEVPNVLWNFSKLWSKIWYWLDVWASQLASWFWLFDNPVSQFYEAKAQKDIQTWEEAQKIWKETKASLLKSANVNPESLWTKIWSAITDIGASIPLWWGLTSSVFKWPWLLSSIWRGTMIWAQTTPWYYMASEWRLPTVWEEIWGTFMWGVLNPVAEKVLWPTISWTFNTGVNTLKKVWEYSSILKNKWKEWLKNTIVNDYKNFVSPVWKSTFRENLSWLQDKDIKALESTDRNTFNQYLKDSKDFMTSNKVASPYEKWSAKAEQAFNKIDQDLKTNYDNKINILQDNHNIVLDNTKLKNDLANDLSKNLNIKIAIDEEWNKVILPIKWRAPLVDIENISDLTALNKLDDLTNTTNPLEYADKIKALQSWVYEKNKIWIQWGVSDKMKSFIEQATWKLNTWMKKQLPPEYAKVMKQMFDDIKLKDNIDRVFQVSNEGNRWELAMKRLVTWTTTTWDARRVAMDIEKRTWIDLINEARLRHLSMKLNWDTKADDLFSVIKDSSKTWITKDVLKYIWKKTFFNPEELALNRTKISSWIKKTSENLQNQWEKSIINDNLINNTNKNATINNNINSDVLQSTNNNSNINNVGNIIKSNTINPNMATQTREQINNINQVYNEFINTWKVPNDIMNNIANKVKLWQKLLPQWKIITPQTAEKWVIIESKKGLEKTKFWNIKNKTWDFLDDIASKIWAKLNFMPKWTWKSLDDFWPKIKEDYSNIANKEWSFWNYKNTPKMTNKQIQDDIANRMKQKGVAKIADTKRINNETYKLEWKDLDNFKDWLDNKIKVNEYKDTKKAITQGNKTISDKYIWNQEYLKIKKIGENLEKMAKWSSLKDKINIIIEKIKKLGK